MKRRSQAIQGSNRIREGLESPGFIRGEDVKVLQYLIGLREIHALPMSREKPCVEVSNSELRRWINDGSVVLNHERWKHDEEMPPLVYSLVFFPKSRHRTTLA